MRNTDINNTSRHNLTAQLQLGSRVHMLAPSYSVDIEDVYWQETHM